jgi:O-antigen ligase
MVVGLHALWRTVRAFQSKGSKRRSRELIAHATILLMVAYLLHEANSATSTSCFLLGGSLILAISFLRSARRPAMVHILAVGAVALAACAAFFNFAGLLAHLGRKSDLTGRTDLWNVVLSQPVSRLFGAGYESFWVGKRVATVQRMAGQFANQSHDGYIEILVNLGWIGVAFLAILIVTGYAKIVRAIRMDAETNCLRLAYVVAALTYNFTEAAFKMQDPVWICFVWAIVSAPMAARMRRRRVIPEPAEYHSQSAAAAGGGAILAHTPSRP